MSVARCFDYALRIYSMSSSLRAIHSCIHVQNHNNHISITLKRDTVHRKDFVFQLFHRFSLHECLWTYRRNDFIGIPWLKLECEWNHEVLRTNIRSHWYGIFTRFFFQWLCLSPSIVIHTIQWSYRSNKEMFKRLEAKQCDINWAKESVNERDRDR